MSHNSSRDPDPDGQLTDRGPAPERLDAPPVVLLRPPEQPSAAVVDAVLRLHGDPRAYRWVPADPLTEPHQAVEMLQRWCDDWRRTGVGYRLVVEGDRVVGAVGVRLLEQPGWSSTPVLNLYYRLDPAVWGRGLASVAARAVLAVDAPRLPGVPVVARIAPGNEASLRLAEKLGFVPSPWRERDGAVVHEVFVLPQR